ISWVSSIFVWTRTAASASARSLASHCSASSSVIVLSSNATVGSVVPYPMVHTPPVSWYALARYPSCSLRNPSPFLDTFTMLLLYSVLEVGGDDVTTCVLGVEGNNSLITRTITHYLCWGNIT